MCVWGGAGCGGSVGVCEGELFFEQTVLLTVMYLKMRNYKPLPVYFLSTS